MTMYKESVIINLSNEGKVNKMGKNIKDAATGLNLVEKILTQKVITYKRDKRFTEMIAYRNALEMIKLAKSGNIEGLELWLAEAKAINEI